MGRVSGREGNPGKIRAVDDVRVGAVLRALRIRRDLRQVDVARMASVSRSVVSLVERGYLARTNVASLRSIAGVLEATIDLVPRWRGAEIDRLLNAGHAAMHEAIARALDELPYWEHAPEVSFSIYGERGVIDILAFHGSSRSLLVIELKTEVANVEDLLAVMSRRTRLARKIASERGWDAGSVSAWVVVAASDANRRRVARFRSTLRSAFPSDGRAIRAWLRRPGIPISALSFWANDARNSATQRVTPRRRVRRA